jgi:N-acetylglucosaminyl-diphospho-decaprenol L-rhamnosyltransferase
MADLAVIIVTWNVRDLVLQAIQTVLDDMESSNLNGQVYVVDSASHDDTVSAIRDHFPQVDLYASPDNLGFGRSNNHAIRRVMASSPRPKAVYLLNPDTITQKGATRALYDALLKQDHVGMVGAQLEYEDGSFQHGAFQFPGLKQLWVELFPTPGRLIESGFNGRYARQLYEQDQPFSVDCTLGATMMLKPEVIEQTGMFDEDFFMYCEEIDWAWRIKKAGWEIQSVPTSRIVHLSGQSTSQIRPQSLLNLWDSRIRLFKKHYPVWKFSIAQKMIARGMTIKQSQTDVPELIETYQKIKEKVL